MLFRSHADVAWRQQADIIIEPDMRTFLWDDFTRTPELVAAGEAAAREALPRIRELIGSDSPDAGRSDVAGKDVISRQ